MRARARARYDLSPPDDRDRGGTSLPLLISAAVEFDGTINDVLSAARSVEATAEEAPAGSASRFSESARGACDSARRLPIADRYDCYGTSRSASLSEEEYDAGVAGLPKSSSMRRRSRRANNRCDD